MSHDFSANDKITDLDESTVNPLRYSSLKTLNEVHNIGEVWANMLYNVYAALVGAHGWSATARTNTAGTEGNIVFMHLFIDSLPLQPCNPTCMCQNLPSKAY